MADGRAAIDRLRDGSGALDRRAVRAILPYGDDFLFVDEVARLTEREVETRFRIPRHAPYLDSHFRDLPVMPGALMCEAFAQAGAILVRYNLEPDVPRDVLGTQVESAKFLSLALPGDQLCFSVRLVTMSRRAARLEGEVGAGGRRIGRMRVVVTIMEREALRQEVARITRAGERGAE